MRSHYDVLGVEASASREEIRRAYRHLVRELHPDGHRGLTAEQRQAMTSRLVAVTDAWKVLGDEDKRLLYDQVWQAAARRAQLVAGGRVIRPDTDAPLWRPPPPPTGARPVGGTPRRVPAGTPDGRPAPPQGGPPASSGTATGPAGAATAPPRSAPAGPGTAFGTAAAPAAPGDIRRRWTPPAGGVPPRTADAAGTAAAVGGAVGPAAGRWGGPWPPLPSDDVSGHAGPSTRTRRPGAPGGRPSWPPPPGTVPAPTDPAPPPGSGRRGLRAAAFGARAGAGRPSSPGPGAGPVDAASHTSGPARPLADGVPGAGRRRWRPRRPDECRLCGSAPAVAVDLRGQRSGVLRAMLTGGVPSERGPLCRDCGMAVLRDLTDVALCGGRPTGRFGARPSRRTLLADVLALGWLLNLLTVVGNLSFWFRLHRLDAPRRDPDVRSPLSAPLDPGLPLRARRGGTVVALVAATVLLAVAALAVAHAVGAIASVPW